MDEPEVTGGGVEYDGEHDDEKMMATPPKVRERAVVSGVMIAYHVCLVKGDVITMRASCNRWPYDSASTICRAVCSLNLYNF